MTDTNVMEIETRTAEHGEKMITLQLRFFTNDIAARPGEIIPKTCHNQGAVIARRMKATASNPECMNIFTGRTICRAASRKCSSAWEFG